MSRKKKNYHKKKQDHSPEIAKEKSSLNLYILITMTVLGAFSVIYFSSK